MTSKKKSSSAQSIAQTVTLIRLTALLIVGFLIFHIVDMLDVIARFSLAYGFWGMVFIILDVLALFLLTRVARRKIYAVIGIELYFAQLVFFTLIVQLLGALVALVMLFVWSYWHVKNRKLLS